MPALCFTQTQIFQLGINFISGFEHLACMTPIHAYEIDRTRLTKSFEVKANPRQEISKICAAHFARCHGEFAVLDDT